MRLLVYTLCTLHIVEYGYCAPCGSTVVFGCVDFAGCGAVAGQTLSSTKEGLVSNIRFLGCAESACKLIV